TLIEYSPFLGMELHQMGYPAIHGHTSKLSYSIGTLSTLFIKRGEKVVVHRVSSPTYFGDSGSVLYSREGKAVCVTSYLWSRNGIPLPRHYFCAPLSNLGI
ncbi:hypothetical protein LCGC14_3096060, partial [marine sediment metagenome]